MAGVRLGSWGSEGVWGAPGPLITTTSYFVDYLVVVIVLRTVSSDKEKFNGPSRRHVIRSPPPPKSPSPVLASGSVSPKKCLSRYLWLVT